MDWPGWWYLAMNTGPRHPWPHRTCLVELFHFRLPISESVGVKSLKSLMVSDLLQTIPQTLYNLYIYVIYIYTYVYIYTHTLVGLHDSGYGWTSDKLSKPASHHLLPMITYAHTHTYACIHIHILNHAIACVKAPLPMEWAQSQSHFLWIYAHGKPTTTFSVAVSSTSLLSFIRDVEKDTPSKWSANAPLPLLLPSFRPQHANMDNISQALDIWVY